MTDFWFAVLATSFVTAITVLVDKLALWLILYTRAWAAVMRITYDDTITHYRKNAQIIQINHRVQALRIEAVTWGAHLAMVALSIDFAAVMIYISNSALFPFFQRLNADNVNRELPLWLLVLAFHSVLLLLSIFCKHLHADVLQTHEPASRVHFPHWGWFRQQRWRLTGSVAGFMSLLSAFVVFTNAL